MNSSGVGESGGGESGGGFNHTMSGLIESVLSQPSLSLGRRKTRAMQGILGSEAMKMYAFVQKFVSVVAFRQHVMLSVKHSFQKSLQMKFP